MPPLQMPTARVAYGGRCTTCGGTHYLYTDGALDAARALERRITAAGRLDFDVPGPGDPRFTTAYLDGTKGPGRMLGVLVAQRRAPSTQAAAAAGAAAAAAAAAAAPSTLLPFADAVADGEGDDADGDTNGVVVLRAFSGQITESWHIPGWVGPVQAVTSAGRHYAEVRRATEALSARIEALKTLQRTRAAVFGGGSDGSTITSSGSTAGSSSNNSSGAESGSESDSSAAAEADSSSRRRPAKPRRPPRPPRQQKQPPVPSSPADAFIASQLARLTARRRALSHELLASIQRSYATRDAGGAPLLLLDAYLAQRAAGDPSLPVTRAGAGFVGFPAGCGDCAAPKLLHAAAQAGLAPLALAEFFYGVVPGAASGGGSGGGNGVREHGVVYGPCDKCRAVLGTMLHGLRPEAGGAAAGGEDGGDGGSGGSGGGGG